VFEELEGWEEDLGDVASFGDLPAAARKYVGRIADLGGVPVSLVSVGPAREQSLVHE
jgi:adenylosuccinate synthase